MMAKKEYSASDSGTAILYGKHGADEIIAYPVIITTGGQLTIVPYHLDGTDGILLTGIDYVSGKSGIDRATETLQIIEYEHHEIHSGSSFTCDYVQDVTNSSTANIIVVTPNTTKWNHITYEFDCESEAELIVYEDAITGTGSTISIYNRNRNSSVTSGTIVQHSPINVTTGSIAIRRFHVGGGKSFGGGDRGSHEIILKQNSKYLIQLVNHTTSNNYMSLKLDWYEHTDKN
jgi:hypothetical protein